MLNSYFEGMNITRGMRAANGAIERVSISDDGALSYETIGGEPARGICGSGLMELVAELISTEVITPSGCFARADKLPPTLAQRLEGEGGGGLFRVSEQVTMSQKDVRQVQLAKGAIRTGIDLLLKQAVRLSLSSTRRGAAVKCCS